MNVVSSALSFYAPIAKREKADDLFNAYLTFLEKRNGSLDIENGFEQREASMEKMASWNTLYRGHIDNKRLNRNFTKFDGKNVSKDELALLSFLKINAGEAYGVEVVTRERAHLHAREEPIFRTERILTHEETYHTKILLGATQHFEGVELKETFRPAWPLRGLIYSLSKLPATLFHPLLLGSEISGVFSFHWLLTRVKTLFPNDPAVRESMERRLIEVLIDEVGHIAYNRIAVGKLGRSMARSIAAQVLRGTPIGNPELEALGFDQQERRNIENFDYQDLPAEVKRNAWFV